MFNKDGLSEMTEAIVYVNLLIAILAIIILYDRNRIDDEDQEKDEQHDKELHDTIEALTLRVVSLEKKLEQLILELQRLQETNSSAT